MTNTLSDEQKLKLAIEACIWGYPRMLYAKYLGEFRAAGAAFNQMHVMSRMATPDHGGVNVDTLYGVGWLDLTGEPLVLDLPDADDRYYSLMLIDVYANNFAYTGRRTTGTKAQQHVVVGPDWQGAVPQGMPLIRATSRYVFAFLRTLIDNEADLPAANRFDAGIGIAPLSSWPEGIVRASLMENLGPYFPHAHNPLHLMGAAYFDRLGDALAEDPPTRSEDQAALERFAVIGVGPGLHPVADNAADEGIFAAALEKATEMIFAKDTNTVTGGWSVNLNFDAGDRDPLFTAAINRVGVGIVGVEEAIYLMSAPVDVPEGFKMPAWTSLGPDGKPLTGDRKYRLRFPPGQLPAVDAFWSLTMYTKNMMLVRNPIDRYAIGDRTAGLQYGEDGSLEIHIQREMPESGPSNWLPAPEGEFQVWIRGYQPRQSWLNGNYQLPPVTIVE